MPEVPKPIVSALRRAFAAARSVGQLRRQVEATIGALVLMGRGPVRYRLLSACKQLRDVGFAPHPRRSAAASLVS